MKCHYIKPNGIKCEAYALSNREFCFFHEPSIPNKEKKYLQSNGGKNRRVTVLVPLEPLELTTADDVKSLLANTVNEVRTGKIDVKIATTIGYLSGYLIKAIEISNIEARLDQIEKKIISDI